MASFDDGFWNIFIIIVIFLAGVFLVTFLAGVFLVTFLAGVFLVTFLAKLDLRVFFSTGFLDLDNANTD